MANVKCLTLANGAKMPMVGLGTWKSKPGEVAEAVKKAIGVGYRMIDCAFIYGNEPEIGPAIKEKISDGTVKREELFIISKLWNTYHRKDLVKKCITQTLNNLQLDYLDIYLMHWPMAYKEDGENVPRDEDGNIILSEIDFLEAWKEMEKLVDEGLTKAIGLSNFNSKQVQRIFDNCRIKPANLQIEINPYLSNERLVNFAHEKGLTVTAHSCLGSNDRPWAKPDDPKLLEDPRLLEIAKKVGKSPAQVVLRWGIQRGYAVIPKTVSEERMKENLQIFDFELSDEDMKTVSSYNHNYRACHLTWVKDHIYYPFKEEF
ncbi:aldose reductase-like [Lingula anatina]|uniref:Aldose reductase-like n=1 Tax=Lingula anatina TaxID=7574 RepID=A0A2R2MT24_LINAN|nr:aldose reductase-like [Lingula anatina]|eukprot:XP_023933268.1 aldose reductase-like [Lingula anatina]